jgi:hypothetical protein
MRRWLIVPVLLALGLGAPAAPPAAEEYAVYGAERFFTLDWQSGDRRGQPVVWGQITNTYGLPARNLRLRVEGLDAEGRVTSSTIGYVPGVLFPSGRTWFEVPVTGTAARWRVTVLSFDWMNNHGIAPAPLMG